MKIVACIKQVPDTEAEVKWDIPKGILNREAMDSVTNPFDEFALEEALLTKENYDGEIIAITMGPDKSADVLRNALALTVDAVYQLTDPAFAGSDTFATANRPCRCHQEDRRRGRGLLRETVNRRQHRRGGRAACTASSASASSPSSPRSVRSTQQARRWWSRGPLKAA